MKVRRQLAILAALLGLISCGGPPTLNPFVAERDARRAISSGDHRLLAVAGFSLEVPGTAMTAGQAEATYGLRDIQGTSDTFGSPVEAFNNIAARNYAGAYNRAVIEAVPDP